MDKFELHLSVKHSGVSAGDLLAQHSTFSKTKIKKIMQMGAVWLTRQRHTQRLRRITRPLLEDDQLHLYYDAEIAQIVPPTPRLITDEQDYSIWYKPAGLSCRGSKYGDHCNIIRWVEVHHQPQRNAFVVHRLDKDTQGILLIAHSKQAAQAFSAMFQQRTIEKKYRAMISGNATAQLKPSMVIDIPLKGKKAVTHILSSVFHEETNQTKLIIKLETGRKHQIRQHLSMLGFPIIGDKLYHDKNLTQNLQLRAISLRFNCPFQQIEKYYEDNNE